MSTSNPSGKCIRANLGGGFYSSWNGIVHTVKPSIVIFNSLIWNPFQFFVFI